MILLEEKSLTPLVVVGVYLGLLLAFGMLAKRLLKTSSSDYFVASRSIGPFLLLMSVFGTTMTAFALVGSTGKSFVKGAGVYGLMASASGIIHSAVFFLIGIKLWAIGKRHNFVTQIQFFRHRFDSSGIGYLLFPMLVGLVIPYLLLGLVGAGTVVRGITSGMFPDTFSGELIAATGKIAFVGAVPPWITGLVVCGVVLAYIIAGGVRAAAMANAAQTIVFMSVGLLAFYLIADALGGLEAASEKVVQNRPELLSRDETIGKMEFMTYMLVPLSVGMFPHLFQHWLTAKSAKTFRVTVIAHPIFIMIVWVPCVLIGVWAAGEGITVPPGKENAVLAKTVGVLLKDPFITGLLMSGILAAIMSSLDSQFVCLGTIFTHDIVIHAKGEDHYTDKQKVMLGRLFILFIVAVTYTLSLFPPDSIFDLAVWCFSGFSSLFPLVFASLYWRRVTRVGAFASILVAAGTWIYFFYQGLIKPAFAGVKPADKEDYLIMGMMPVAIMFAASALVLIVVSLMTQPPPKSVVDSFFDDRKPS